MNPTERAYLKALMAKRDGYLAARDQEWVVPERPPCLTGYASVYEVQALLENLTKEWGKWQS